MGGNIDTSNKEGKWKREISRGNRQHGVLEGPDSFSRAYVCALYIFAPCNRTCVYIYIYICIHVYIYIYIYIYILRLYAARGYTMTGEGEEEQVRARGALPYIPSFFSDPLGVREYVFLR